MMGVFAIQNKVFGRASRGDAGSAESAEEDFEKRGSRGGAESAEERREEVWGKRFTQRRGGAEIAEKRFTRRR